MYSCSHIDVYHLHSLHSVHQECSCRHIGSKFLFWFLPTTTAVLQAYISTIVSFSFKLCIYIIGLLYFHVNVCDKITYITAAYFYFVGGRFL